ncbi:MAG TPA: hypothetical protein VMV29_13710 [Ktedonobacterales bacterium]|nr:hypothetical protein [Ktedonobacterales bacterium]
MQPLIPHDMNQNNARHLPAAIPPATSSSVAPAAPKGKLAPAAKAAAPQAPSGASFTPAEVVRLTALRDNYTSHAEYLERDYDDCRLEFARWLADHGKISER